MIANVNRPTVKRLLAGLKVDLRQYQMQINRLFTQKLTRPRDCSRCFFDILVSASRLYLDYLLLRELEAHIYAEDPRPKRRPIVPYSYSPRAGTAKEESMRAKFRSRVESLKCWGRFQPESEFADDNHLRSLEDYINTLELHLPEIYGETFNMELSLKRFVEEKDFAAVADLIVGLAHIAHHVSYCHYALEILSEDRRWR
jgi:hypothetical protein